MHQIFYGHFKAEIDYIMPLIPPELLNDQVKRHKDYEPYHTKNGHQITASLDKIENDFDERWTEWIYREIREVQKAWLDLHDADKQIELKFGNDFNYQPVPR